MTYPLPLRPVPVHRETLPSFLSRFAAMNGSTLANFSTDLGHDFRRFLNFDQEPIDRLSQAAGLSSGQVEDMISWTGRAIGDVRTEFRGEVFTSKAVRNPVMRGCPVCLREDAEKAPNNPIPMMAMRGDWLLREASVCCKHGHVLVPLWEHTGLVDRYDTRANLPAILDSLLAGEILELRRTPSSYDLWLDRRLQSGQDATWLATQGLFVSTTMCSLLGSILTPRASGGVDEICAAQQEGFAVLSEGSASYRDALLHVAMRSGGGQFAPRRVFGKLYDALGDYLDDNQFDLFRNILRDCIMDTWPLAAGDLVLGQAVPRRTLHSPTTAAREIGVTVGLVEKFLVDAGAIPDPGNDQRPPALRTFDAWQYADVLAEIPTLVGPIEMQAAIGATKAQLKSLKEDGILKPRIARGKIDSPWRISDGLALLRELEGLLAHKDQDSADWEDIQSASKRKRMRVGQIIHAIRRGELRLGQVSGASGYRSFSVLKAEVDEMARSSAQLQSEMLPVTKGRSASVFARELGIRTKGWYQALVEAGHADGTWEHHPVTHVLTLYVSDDDAACFRRRFVTLPQMQHEFGMHKHTCLSRLRAAGVRPFSLKRQSFGPLYEREQAEAVLRGAAP